MSCIFTHATHKQEEGACPIPVQSYFMSNIVPEQQLEMYVFV